MSVITELSSRFPGAARILGFNSQPVVSENEDINLLNPPTSEIKDNRITGPANALSTLEGMMAIVKYECRESGLGENNSVLPLDQAISDADNLKILVSALPEVQSTEEVQELISKQREDHTQKLKRLRSELFEFFSLDSVFSSGEIEHEEPDPSEIKMINKIVYEDPQMAMVESETSTVETQTTPFDALRRHIGIPLLKNLVNGARMIVDCNRFDVYQLHDQNGSPVSVNDEIRERVRRHIKIQLDEIPAEIPDSLNKRTKERYLRTALDAFGVMPAMVLIPDELVTYDSKLVFEHHPSSLRS